MEIRLPALGESITSGTVINILVSEGDRVEKDQDLLEMETDKAVAVVPSPEAGKVVKIHIKEGDELKVGEPILTLSQEGNGEKPKEARQPKESAKPEAKDESRTDDEEPESTDAEEQQDGEEEKRPVAAAHRHQDAVGPPAPPSIRKLARQLGIDLNRVQGTERGGRIVIDDLRVYIEYLQRIAFDRKPEREIQKAEKEAPPLPDFAKWGYVKKEPMQVIRKKISEAMAASWTSIPHVTQFGEADISDLMDQIKKHAPRYEKESAHLTLTSIIIKALVPLLKRYPRFNSSIDESAGEIVLKDYFHFGIAVDTEQGLIVPVLRDVDRKGMLELSKELANLAEKTRRREITLEELRGGTFTISNQGGIGGSHFTPIIHAPEVAILGLGRGALKPAVKDKKIEARRLLPLALSYDHRLIDGADAARFIRDLIEALETFPEENIKLEGGDEESKKAAPRRKKSSPVSRTRKTKQ